MKNVAKNCWEYKQCGREPGGKNEAELGACSAAMEERFDGVNGGKNAGRFCWFVSGTLCEGKIQGTFAKKVRDCIACDFYLSVEREKGRHIALTEDEAWFLNPL